MHISTAIEKLKQGKKITHLSWPKDSYLQIDSISTHMMFFQYEATPFNITPDILLSSNWYTLDGSHTSLDFVQALALLSQGYKLSFEENDLSPSFSFIEMDMISKDIYQKKIIHRDFILDQKSLFSNEWVEVQ